MPPESNCANRGEASAFDTHAHLDDERFKDDLEDVVRRAKAAGVAQILTVGTDIESSRRAIEIAKSHDGICAAVGVHPHESGRFGEQEEKVLRELCASRAGVVALREPQGDPEHGRRVVAVGEMGLDYYRDYAPREAQIAAFRKQLQIAADIGLPVIVHNRQAMADCLATMAEFKGRVRGVAHCFSGDIAAARSFMNLGFLISIAGPVTFPNSTDLQRLAAFVPDDFLLVETDCPYLAPQPCRGKRNEPAFVRYTLQTLASLRKVPTAGIIEITTRNAKNLFLMRDQRRGT